MRHIAQEFVKITVFCDGSFGRLNGIQSVIGTISFLEGENGKVCPVDWSSQKLKVPAASALQAEAEAAREAYGRALHLKASFENLTGVRDMPVNIVTDSRSLKENVNSDNMPKDKRTAIAVSILREAQDSRQISINWVEGKNQLADILTKDSVNPSLLRGVLKTGQI